MGSLAEVPQQKLSDDQTQNAAVPGADGSFGPSESRPGGHWAVCNRDMQQLWWNNCGSSEETTWTDFWSWFRPLHAETSQVAERTARFLDTHRQRMTSILFDFMLTREQLFPTDEKSRAVPTLQSGAKSCLPLFASYNVQGSAVTDTFHLNCGAQSRPERIIQIVGSSDTGKDIVAAGIAHQFASSMQWQGSFEGRFQGICDITGFMCQLAASAGMAVVLPDVSQIITYLSQNIFEQLPANSIGYVMHDVDGIVDGDAMYLEVIYKMLMAIPQLQIVWTVRIPVIQFMAESIIFNALYATPCEAEAVVRVQDSNVESCMAGPPSTRAWNQNLRAAKTLQTFLTQNFSESPIFSIMAQLSESDMMALCGLTIFPSSFDTLAASAILESCREQVESHFETFIALGLMRSYSTSNRYELYASAKSFVTQLCSQNQIQFGHQRHRFLAHYADVLCKIHATKLAGAPLTSAKMFGADQTNFLQAVTWAVEDKQIAASYPACETLLWYGMPHIKARACFALRTRFVQTCYSIAKKFQSISMESKARWHYGLLLKEQAQVQEALTHMQGAVDEMSNDVADISKLELALCYKELAEVYGDLYQYSSAELYLGRAYALERDLLGHKHDTVLSTMLLHAQIMTKLSKYKEAEEVLYMVITCREITQGLPSGIFVHATAQLAVVLQSLGNFASAYSMYKRCIYMQLGSGNDECKVKMSLKNVGLFLSESERFSELIEYYQMNLASKEDFFGRHHKQVFLGMNDLANALSKAKDLNMATHFLYVGMANSCASDDATIFLGYCHLATIALSSGRNQEALCMCRSLQSLTLHLGDLLPWSSELLALRIIVEILLLYNFAPDLRKAELMVLCAIFRSKRERINRQLCVIAYRLLAKIRHALGRPCNAKIHLRRASKLCRDLR